MDVLDQALTTLDAGGLIIVADDEERENEGDFIGLADRVTPEMINFMITHGRGLVCFPMARPLADRLKLSRMVPDTADPFRTAFTQSIDAHPRFGVTTGDFRRGSGVDDSGGPPGGCVSRGPGTAGPYLPVDCA